MILAAAFAVLLATDAPNRLPPELLDVLDERDPFALADTRLPRLEDLDERDRLALSERIASWSVPRRVAAFAFLHVGVPYVNGPLGEEAPPDTDPLIRFDIADCATLNLVSEALAHARDAGGERRAMARANYRAGRVTYEDRLHFTTDRLDVSPYDRDITARVAGRAGVRARSRRVQLNQKRDGTRWIDVPWTRSRVVRYLPTAAARDFPAWRRRGILPEAVGVAFVQASKHDDGLDVVHESLLWNGRVLLHGSSRIGRVTTVDWINFLAERGHLYDGFVLFEYR